LNPFPFAREKCEKERNRKTRIVVLTGTFI
jgi:hypothetical protein